MSCLHATDLAATILVVNWNTREFLRACLNSIASSTRELAVETIVVDNGSTDGSVEMLESEFPWVTRICNRENVGFAGGNNQGLRAARGRYVLLLNSDAELLPNSLQRLVQVLEHRSDVAVVGGMLLNPDMSFQHSYCDFPTVWSEVPGLLGIAPLLFGPHHPSHSLQESQRARDVDWVSGAFMMVRRQALDSVGVLDESYFMYSEEVDWCFRFRRLGWRVCYVPDAVAVHHIGGSAQRVPQQRRAQIYRAKWLFLRKHRPPVQAQIFLVLMWACSVMKLAGWLVLSIVPLGGVRRQARGHVSSYRRLLTQLRDL